MDKGINSTDLFRARAEVDLGAIKRNLSAVSQRLPSDISPVAVIKADAYGHGALRVAKATEDAVSAFAVATAGEAIELSEGGIRKPIYILGFSHPALSEEIVSHSLIPTVFSKEDAMALSKTARAKGKDVHVNIKVDTGMGRIGFAPLSESVTEIKEIASLERIKIHGVFSHFSTSDEKDKTFTNLQSDIFSGFISALEDAGVKFERVHISNSAAVLDMPYLSPSSSYKKEARIGIALYGLYPSKEVSRSVTLERAMTFKSHVVYIKDVPPGTPIGYSRAFTTIRPSRIATIPVGYADGYSRRLSSYGRVMIRGQYAPVVGKICMDMCMVDITDIKDAALWDEVTLMGTDGDCSVSAEDIAALTGTISYEVVCSIGKRVPRVYIEE